MAAIEPAEALQMAGLPVAIGGGSTLLLSWLPPKARSLGAALSVAVAYYFAHRYFAGEPTLPPTETLHWLPYLAAGGVVMCGIALVSKKLAAALWILLAGAAVWAFVAKLATSYYEWSTGETALWFGVTGAVLLLLQVPATALEDKHGVGVGILAVVAGSSASVAMMEHSAKIAQLFAALGFALGGIALVSLVMPKRSLGRGGAASGIAALSSLFLYCFHYVEIPLEILACLAAGWGTVLLTAIPKLQALAPRRALVIHSLVAVIPCLIAVALAYQRYSSQPANPYY